MTVSETRKAQIIDELTRHGVQPNEAAIAQIIEAMKADQRVSIKSACKKLAETQGTNHTAQTRAAERANSGASHQMGIVQQMGEMMGHKMTEMAGAIAVETFMNNIANGNFGTAFDAQLGEAFQTMNSAWDTQYQRVIGGEKAPLLLESTPVEDA